MQKVGAVRQDINTVATVAELCERWLAPKEGANLEAGKALMRRNIEEAQA